MEKQIEEIAKIIGSLCDTDEKPCELCELRNKDGDDYRCFHLFAATALYNADYRKQTEGEWREDVVAFCNVCSSCRAMVDRSAIKCRSGKLHFCPNCGAKMKGEKDGKQG